MPDPFAAPWTVTHQVPLSMEFPRQESLSSLPFPTPRNLPNPGIEHPTPALAGGFLITEPPEKDVHHTYIHVSLTSFYLPIYLERERKTTEIM